MASQTISAALRPLALPLYFALALPAFALPPGSGDGPDEQGFQVAAAPVAPGMPPASAGTTEAQAGQAPLPEIHRSDAELPEPVRRTREQLLEAARSGDLEELRAVMVAQPEPPSVSFGDSGDPIEYLKALSTDPAGREILAVLLEVLESGYVHVAPEAGEELYVWPYFAQYPLEALTPSQLVELFTLVTAADYEDMRSYGAYTFFRVGIAADGRWMFFVAGD
jgi:hypothetical protein